MTETRTRNVQIAGRRFSLRHADVVEALRDRDPEPIRSHYIVVGAQRFPPKQVISAVTGLDRADFTTHQARGTLLRLGFAAGRRGVPGSRNDLRSTGGPATPADAPNDELASRLRHLGGLWVAIKDEDVLHAAPTPRQLVSWLAEHGQSADTVYRVPEDDLAASGLAPL